MKRMIISGKSSMPLTILSGFVILMFFYLQADNVYLRGAEVSGFIPIDSVLDASNKMGMVAGEIVESSPVSLFKLSSIVVIISLAISVFVYETFKSGGTNV